MAGLTETLLRVYQDLVRGRTTVRVLPAQTARMDTVPIFLTGVFRSGTTLTRYIVDSHSQLCCPPESNFIRALASLLEDRDNREGLRSMGYDEEHVLGRIRDFVAYFMEGYAASTGKKRWADKTPAYVQCLEFVDRLFPTAQHLMIYRHGLDVAHSITRNGEHAPPYLEPYRTRDGDPRVAAAAYWAACTRKMLDFQAAHPERCHMIRYEQLCRAPEPVLRPLFAFLNEPWEAAVLEYWKFDHDRGFEDAWALAARGFSLREGGHRGWPEEVIARAEHAARPVLAELDYEVDWGAPAKAPMLAVIPGDTPLKPPAATR